MPEIKSIKPIVLVFILAVISLITLGNESKNNNIVISGQVFADNYFELYVNGKLIAIDPIEFTPHNVVPIEFTARYPLVIAVKAKDFADPRTGLEYNNTRIGDGGFILKLSNGIVTNNKWKAKKIFWGPLDSSCLRDDPANNCKVAYEDIPDNWYAVDFDDSSWPFSSVFTEREVRPHGDYYEYDWQDADFIWTEDLELDNTIIFRFTVDR